jgi:AcrB/AcrD/AcrF family
MTTIAMVAGMLPAAFAFGDGGEFRSPMAIAVIGGLLVSTALSLVFVPAAFTVLDDAGRLFWRAFGRLVGEQDEPNGACASDSTAAIHGVTARTDQPAWLRHAAE